VRQLERYHRDIIAHCRKQCFYFFPSQEKVFGNIFGFFYQEGFWEKGQKDGETVLKWEMPQKRQTLLQETQKGHPHKVFTQKLVVKSQISKLNGGEGFHHKSAFSGPIFLSNKSNFLFKC